jgi:DNA gyrase/topoisomerase IV subunit B
MEEDDERRYVQLSQLEHLKKRPNMYIGSVVLQSLDIYLLDNERKKLNIEKIKYSPGLLKIFDEIICNAVDHYFKNNAGKNKVKNIKVKFNIENGMIEVYNDGPGISVIKVDTLNSGKIYKPQAIVSQFLGGDNLDSSDRIVSGMNGLGFKCLNFNTDVLLFNGETKKAKEITKDDILIGDDGTKRNILSITTGHGKMYEIKQSNGYSYKVNSEHILTLCASIKNNNSKLNIIDISVKDYLKLSKRAQNSLTGIRGECIKWDAQEITLDPYIVGEWLGYDCLLEHDDDYEIIEHLKMYNSMLNAFLRKYKLINNKYIPNVYLINTREIRMRVLAGIIDSSGHLSKNADKIIISQKLNNNTLLENIAYLVRSLGFHCSIQNSITQEIILLHISENIYELCPLLRKNWSIPKIDKSCRSMGNISIKEIDADYYIGFKLDGNQRFLINDFTVTHNCTNAFSDEFIIETYDEKKTMLYKQTFRDRLEIIEEPIIEKTKDIGHTSIKFLPSYKALGYKKYTGDIAQTIHKLIEVRTYQTAAFVDCDVWFNDIKIDFDDKKSKFEQFAEMFLTDPVFRTILKAEDKRLNMEVCIGLSDGKFSHFSIVNNILIYDGGTHVKHLQNELLENLKPFVEKELKKTKNKFNANYILNHLFVFVKCSMINPEFDSQSKAKITNTIQKFEEYKFDKKDIKKVWDLIEPHVMQGILGKIRDKPKTRVDRKKIILEKGEDAKFAGDKKKALECTLFIAEGDSALGILTRGISHKHTSLDKDYYGTFSIQGVPPNCRKLCKEMMDKKTNKSIKIRNAKLQENKRFKELVQIIGLDYEKSYELTDLGDKEFKSLRYGKAVVATDQDVDGTGQIFGLLLNFFVYFWPALAERGFIKRFNTPIIRAYPNDTKKLVKEFHSQYLYNMWIKSEFDDDEEKAAKKYKIKYYKGLASNDMSEIRPMFNKFENKLYTYDLDKFAEQNLEVYFGKETAHRKEVLALPVSEEDEIKDDKISNIEISHLLRTDVKEFQRDNIVRKLPHIMDGLVPSRRKAFFAARLNPAMKTKEVKVCNFTGEVISKTNYHHGDASLGETIIKMAQNFVGARNMPLLIGVGEFGVRQNGGKDHGSPRYVFVKLNTRLTTLLYPYQDDFLLPYVFDEGDRCEPIYYIPILPTSVMESMEIPATGWKAQIWARNYKDVIKNVRRMIIEQKACKKIGIWMRGNNSTIKIVDDKTFIIGKYTYDTNRNIITVTELPPTVFNKSYIKSIAYATDTSLKPDFKDVIDHSNYDEDTNIDEVKINFELNDNVVENIMDKYNNRKIKEVEYDPIEEFMKLKIAVNSNINMIDIDGKVVEFKFYSTVINKWFIERKKLYTERVKRFVILTRLMIKYLENIIRFSKERDNLNITNKTPEIEFNTILETAKYDKFNKTLLLNPKYTKVEDLEKMINSNSSNSNSSNFNCNYEYIISLTYRSLLEEACVKRREELKSEKNKLKDLLSDCKESDTEFIGQKTWLKELDELELVIDDGIKNGWDHKGKNKARFA